MLSVWRAKSAGGVAMAPRDLPVLGRIPLSSLNGEVLEKPRDAEHAAAMLRAFR
jgi:septum formation protein